jgi:hypothetical protein
VQGPVQKRPAEETHKKKPRHRAGMHLGAAVKRKRCLIAIRRDYLLVLVVVLLVVVVVVVVLFAGGEDISSCLLHPIRTAEIAIVKKSIFFIPLFPSKLLRIVRLPHLGCKLFLRQSPPPLNAE